jgi:hypothetical protein
MEFEGLVANDHSHVGLVLDNLDTYSADVIHDAITKASNEVLQAFFGVYQEARDVLTNRLDTLLASGGTMLESDIVQQYCLVLIPLLEDINAANHANGVALEAESATQQQLANLQQAEDDFWGYLTKCWDVYNAIFIFQENAEWGLGDYLMHVLGTGGCNNASVNWAMTVIQPYAEHGFIRLEQKVRDHLQTQVGIVV